MKRRVGNDARIPQPSVSIFYDWHNFGIGDCAESSRCACVKERIVDGLTAIIGGNYHDGGKHGIVKIQVRYIGGHG